MSCISQFKLWEPSKYVKHEGINKKEASPSKHLNFSSVKFFQKHNLKNVSFLIFTLLWIHCSHNKEKCFTFLHYLCFYTSLNYQSTKYTVPYEVLKNFFCKDTNRENQLLILVPMSGFTQAPSFTWKQHQHKSPERGQREFCCCLQHHQDLIFCSSPKGDDCF